VTFPDPHPYVTEGLGPPTMLLGPTDGVDVEGLVAVAEGTAKSGGRVTSFWAAQVLASRPWVVLVVFFVGWGNVDCEGGGLRRGSRGLGRGRRIRRGSPLLRKCVSQVRC